MIAWPKVRNQGGAGERPDCRQGRVLAQQEEGRQEITRSSRFMSVLLGRLCGFRRPNQTTLQEYLQWPHATYVTQMFKRKPSEKSVFRCSKLGVALLSGFGMLNNKFGHREGRERMEAPAAALLGALVGALAPLAVT